MKKLLGAGLAVVLMGSFAPSSDAFVRLPYSGRGYSWYCPYASHHWGTSRMIYKIKAIANKWKDWGCPGNIKSGDISKQYGGYFSPHATHRYGKDADFQPMTKYGGGQTYVGAYNYSRYYTQKFVYAMRATSYSIRVIYFNDSRVSYVRYASGHHNHLHLSIY